MIVVNDTLVKAISWTLVHSVWQGFLLAMIVGIVIVSTKKSTAALRYNLFLGLFFCFLVVVGITFNYEYGNGHQEVTTRFNLPLQNIFLNIENQYNTSTQLSDYIINYLNANANVIVFLWLLVFSVKCFTIFNNLNHIYRIRNYRTQTPSEYWTARVTTLCEMLYLKITVVLLESPLVKVPSVTGFFKPIILIPIGLLSNLPHDQMEAILLHELAHIRRRDYIVNLGQHLAETIFFFNPGLLWLSSLLKEERENCCDDMAISVIENKGRFVHALVSFEEYNIKNSELSLRFGSTKKHLLNRAKRIIYNDNKSLNGIEKTFLSVSLLVIAIVMIACAHSKTVENILNKKEAVADKKAALADIAARKEDVLAYKEDVSAKREDSLARLEDIKAMQADKEALKADIEKMKLPDFVNQPNAVPQAPMQTCTPSPPANLSNTTQTTTRTVMTDTKTEKSYKREENGGKKQIFTGVSGEDLPENIDVESFTNNIISDLIHQKVIQCSTNLSFILSKKNMIVNGVALPESIYSKLKDKYLKGKNKYNSICYNYEYATAADLR